MNNIIIMNSVDFVVVFKLANNVDAKYKNIEIYDEKINLNMLF